MRTLGKDEKEKRGCRYCADRKGGGCKHDECPYHELDEFDTYEDFFESQGGLLDGLFEEGGSE